MRSGQEATAERPAPGGKRRGVRGQLALCVVQEVGATGVVGDLVPDRDGYCPNSDRRCQPGDGSHSDGSASEGNTCSLISEPRLTKDIAPEPRPKGADRGPPCSPMRFTSRLAATLLAGGLFGALVDGALRRRGQVDPGREVAPMMQRRATSRPTRVLWTQSHQAELTWWACNGRHWGGDFAVAAGVSIARLGAMPDCENGPPRPPAKRGRPTRPILPGWPTGTPWPSGPAGPARPAGATWVAECYYHDASKQFHERGMRALHV
jgi:hypothetical protein